ncbi:MAG: hypothetical protein LBS45_09925 [Synergistaceae bacterium]|nr:hypothetical protein [Synergistaceae bacterium]
MKNRRKIFALLAVVMILAFAGSAFAYCGRHGGGGWGIGRDWDDGEPRGQGYGGPAYGGADIPQELRDKMTEARNVMYELRAELTKTPVDKEKALAIFRRHRDIRNEIGEWFFMERIERLK